MSVCRCWFVMCRSTLDIHRGLPPQDEPELELALFSVDYV